MENTNGKEQQLTINNAQLAASKEVLTLDETAIFTGLSKSYLYKLTSRGIIPHSKPMGKLLFFSRAEVQAWLLGSPVKTIAEIETQAGNYVTLKTGRL